MIPPSGIPGTGPGTPASSSPYSGSSGSGSAQLKAGTHFGPYVLEKLLGRGGMGAVYRARHKQTGATHAVKVMAVAHRSDTQIALARFQREMDVLASIEGHPGVVRIHSCGADMGLPWCAMEYVDGGSLADRIEDAGQMKADEAATLLIQVSNALEHVHKNGIVHRDLKPENVLLDSVGRARVVDFGLAYDVFSDRLTKTGELLGTPAFMAPEQVSRRSESEATESGSYAAIGPEADVYGLGALLYTMVTGRPPFDGKDALGMIVDVMRRPPVRPRKINPAMPPELEQICLRALEKEPKNRYRSAGEFAAELQHWLRGESVEANRLRERMGRAARRTIIPATRGGQVALGLLAGALLVAGLSGLVYALRVDRRPAVERLAEIEQEVDRRGELRRDDADGLRRLVGEIAEDDGAIPPHVRDRIELLSLLYDDAIAGERPSETKLARLTALVRPAGELERTLLQRAEKVLARRELWRALDHVLHASEPVAAVSRQNAADLARVIARRPPPAGRPPVPADPLAFEALYKAPGLESELGGRLQVLRGEAALARGEAAWDDAIDAFTVAIDKHHLELDGAEWPRPFVEECLNRLVKRVQRADDQCWELAEIVVAGTIEADELPVWAVQELMTTAHAHMGIYGRRLGDAKKAELNCAFLVGAFLQRYAQAPFGGGELIMFQRGIGKTTILERGNEELAKSPARRHAPSLLLAARLLVLGAPNDRALDEQARERARRWLRAAEERKPDGLWYHTLVAKVVERLGQREDAIAHMRRALELDRRRPLARRWTLIAAELADLLLHEDFEEALALMKETTEVGAAVAPRVVRISEEGGLAPMALHWSAYEGAIVERGVERLLRLGAPRCCAHPVKPEELIDPTIALSKGDYHEARMLYHRARHHLLHGRKPAAEADLASAVDIERTREVNAGATSSIVPYERQRLHALADYLDARAELLRELGRSNEAEGNEQEAKRARAEAKSLK